MARDDERIRRAQQTPVVGSLPDAPGILAAMSLTPGLGTPGATLRRTEREMLAPAVSAGNDCFFCMDSHAAFATALVERGDSAYEPRLLDEIKRGSSDGFDPKMRALLHIARTVGRDSLKLTDADVHAAKDAGATDADVQLAVLIAAAFSMYNRLVDGFRAMTAPSAEAYRERAGVIAEFGYSAAPPPTSVATPAE